AERAVADVVARARAADPGVDVRRLTGADLDPSLLLELTSPSLFGDTTVLVVAGAHELSPEAAAAVAGLVRNPVEAGTLGVVHSGATSRAKSVRDACREARAATVSCPRLTKISERVDFVRAEARGAGSALADDAARAVVDAVGSDLRELAAATAQLVADS